MNKKRLIIIIAIALVVAIAASVAVVLVANSNKPGVTTTTNPGPKPGPDVHQGVGVHTYNDYTAVSPSNWNELTYQDNNDTQIMSYIGSSFFSFDFKFDPNGEILPGEFTVNYNAATSLVDVTAKYAEAWGLDPDSTGYAYAITLRNDLKWENGDPIKAEDFVYSMMEQLNPLFRNYRADSYYNSAQSLVGAKLYAKQGQAGYDVPKTDVYSEDLDASLIFTLAPPETTVNGKTLLAEVALRTMMGFPASYNAKSCANYLIANYLGECAFTLETAAAMEGKTFAEIKADPTLKAAWDALIGWWQTEPNEELHFFLTDGAYPEVSWTDEEGNPNVGIFVGENEYEIVIVLEKALELLKEDGSLDYTAAYNMSSLPLVHKATYEANKVAPQEGVEGALWTSTYNSSVETTMSWGAYKLTEFQAGKYYKVERNDYWYGYGLPENEGLYQTDVVYCETIGEWNTAWLKFLSGEIEGIGIDVSVAPDYKNSSRAYYTPDDYVGSMQLQSSKEALENRETEGVNKTILTYADFRKAISLAVNRAEYNDKCTTASLAGFGLYNSMHYYDVANGGAFRNTDEAKKVLCEVYSVDYTQYTSLDEAVAAITGYNLPLAKELVTSAYNQAVADGEISGTDKVVLTFGTSVINESTQRQYDFLSGALKEMVVGTPLEGRLETELKDFASAWANDFRAGAYDICTGGWTGAAWDPGYFLLAYLSPDYMYSAAWDTSSEMMTFTMVGVGEDGGDITETMSLMEWYDCLNGNSGCKYNWSSAKLPESKRLQLIAALEKAVLQAYYTVPISYSFAASMLSYKVDYITYEYNTFMGYGGMKYMTYNYDDAEWAAILEENNGQLDYKR